MSSDLQHCVAAEPAHGFPAEQSAGDSPAARSSHTHAMNNLARRVGLCYSLAAVVSTGSCAAGPPPAAPSSPTAPAVSRRAVVLGDSLAVSPSRAEGFPSELERRLNARQPGWIVSNA